MNLLRFSTLSMLLLVFVVSGCDNATLDPSDDAGIDANEDAAVAIANAVALESGGALNAAADAVDVVVSDAAKSGAGCEHERSYDESTQTWTGFVSCEFGNPDRLFYSLFSRTRTYQFLDESGSPQQFPEGAQTLNFAIVEGEGIRQRPGFSHELLDLGADFVVDDLGQELKTVNGAYNRSATDTLYTRNVERTLTYDLALTFIDVQGAGRIRDGNRPVSGTIEGVYEAVHTFSSPDGAREQTVNRSFTITFGGGDDGDITIDVGGDTFRADLMTGEVEGID